MHNRSVRNLGECWREGLCRRERDDVEGGSLVDQAEGERRESALEGWVTLKREARLCCTHAEVVDKHVARVVPHLLVRELVPPQRRGLFGREH
eukprot:CAMPEP_0180343034 /NCGR_PEP_ID=MMETSP0989-20121125/2064_1 /TAXON_ID=697907 /ORGANISM="non described non described, Strain CCMP2293" /LENGTH=92 /DNA_ID=CAMNT_0022331951 /DNA_START=134 /DNA_END=409 /DNA_ORIENTATION=-